MASIILRSRYLYICIFMALTPLPAELTLSIHTINEDTIQLTGSSTTHVKLTPAGQFIKQLSWSSSSEPPSTVYALSASQSIPFLFSGQTPLGWSVGIAGTSTLDGDSYPCTQFNLIFSKNTQVIILSGTQQITVTRLKGQGPDYDNCWNALSNLSKLTSAKTWDLGNNNNNNNSLMVIPEVGTIGFTIALIVWLYFMRGLRRDYKQPKR